MKLLRLTGLFLLEFILFGCGSKLPENYHMEKRYWDVADYKDALRQINFRTPEEEGLPRFSDPVTAPVVKKLTDKQNVSVVLEDEQLGLNYRNKVATDFFHVSKDVINIYQQMDVQDKYIYPLELVSAIEFGLHTQILYFKIGNDAIISDAVNPEASDVKRIVRKNEQTVVNNFELYIEYLTKEEAFNEAALKKYAEVLNEYFTRLTTEFKDADFSGLKKTASLMQEKVKNPEIKAALDDLIKRLEKKNEALAKKE